MGIEQFDGGVVVTGPHIRWAQMCAARHAIRLEQHGFRRGSNRSIKAAWAVELGLPKGAHYDKVLSKLDEEIKSLKAELDNPGGLSDQASSGQADQDPDEEVWT